MIHGVCLLFRHLRQTGRERTTRQVRNEDEPASLSVCFTWFNLVSTINQACRIHLGSSSETRKNRQIRRICQRDDSESACIRGVIGLKVSNLITRPAIKFCNQISKSSGVIVLTFEAQLRSGPIDESVQEMTQLVVLLLVLRACSAFAAPPGNLTFQDPFQLNVFAKNLEDLSSKGNVIKYQTDFHPINSSTSERGFFDANNDLFGGQKLNFFGSSSLKGGLLNDKLDESIQKMMQAFSSQTKNLGTSGLFKGNMSQFMIVKRDKNSRASPKRGQVDDIWSNLEGQNRNRFDEKYRFIRHVEFDKFNNRLGLALSRLNSDQEIKSLTRKVVSLMGNGYYFIIFNCTKPMFIGADNKVETLSSRAALDVLKKDDSCQPSSKGGGDDIWHYKAEPPADLSTYDFKAQAISEQVLPFTKLLDVFSRVGLCDEFLRFMNHPAYFFDENRFAKPKACAEPDTKPAMKKKSRDGNKKA